MNGQEIEAKFHVQNLGKIELRLLELKAQLIQPRVHEVNLRFDRPDRELRNSQRVLRLRQDDIARFTFKGPSVEEEGGILSRQEIEFEVGNFESAKHFLEAIGFEVVVFYEKFRTTYELNNTHIMLDKLPYGSFIEIEGENAETIRSVADALDLNWEAMVKAGYHALFERVAGKYGLDVSKLSFAALEKIKITTDDLNIQAADSINLQ
ncbi:MAG: class IV adenylate cyclase [Anaerolineales bacterium]|nr:class IV adenylate cyclase [Anaerolineales bacterium]